jgi:hypothetical protein
MEVFICGVHRSGTTMLCKWLQSQSGFSGPLATGFPEDESIFLSSSFDTTPDIAAPGRFALNPASYIERDPFPGEPERILTEWESHFQPKEYNSWVVKSPVHIIHYHFLRKCWPNAKIICVVRDPRSVVLANDRMQQSWSGTTSLEDIQLNWETANRYFYRQTAGDPNAMMIRYPELGDLDKIGEFLGIRNLLPIPFQNRDEDYIIEWNERELDLLPEVEDLATLFNLL